MWILLTLLYGIVALAPSYSLDELDCSQARTSRVAVEAGAASEILDQANADDGIGVCRLRSTCCTAAAENALKVHGRQKVLGDVVHTHSYMKKTFSQLELKLQGVFNKILDDSREKAISVFQTVYGEHADNEHFFDDFFDGLFEAAKNFYKSPGEVPVHEVLQNLFYEIIVEMFKKVQDSGAELSKAYEKCVIAAAVENDPFGLQDDRTIKELGRAMNATSVFLVGVQVAYRVLYNFLNFIPTEECVNEYAQMQLCSLCGGYAGRRPCSDLCMNVMNGCLGDLSELSTAFDKYLNASSNMITVLKNLSPGSTIHGLGHELSLGVSGVFPLLLTPISPLYIEITKLCGAPNGKRRKRAVSKHGLPDSSRGKRSARTLSRNQGNVPTPRSHPQDLDLDTQLAFAKETLSLFQFTIGNTASEICYKLSEEAGSDCWNGTALGSFEGPFGRRMQIGLERKQTIRKSVRALKEATSMLRNWHSVSNWKIGQDLATNRDQTNGNLNSTDDNTIDENTISGNGMDENTIDNEIKCPEDDEDLAIECENNSGSGSSGSEPSELPTTGDPTAVIVRSSARMHHFFITAMVAVLITLSAFVV